MRRYSVNISETADADLGDILRFINESSGSARTAKRFTDRIVDRCRKIGDLPFADRRRDDLSSGLRTIPFENRTIIAYRVLEDCVEITNVFYGGRDYEALFRNASDQ